MVDREGRALGVITVDMIAEVMRSGDHVVPEEPQGPEEDGIGPLDLAETRRPGPVEAEAR